MSYLASVAPEYWEGLEWSEVLALNEIGYCENTFASFRKWLVSVPQATQNLFYNFSLVLKSVVYFLSIYTLSDELE